MHWTFFCPGCDHPLQGRPGEEGGWGSCPGCLVRFRVPGPAAPPRPDRWPSPLVIRLAGACSILALAAFLAWRLWPVGKPAPPSLAQSEWEKRYAVPRLDLLGHEGRRGKRPAIVKPSDALVIPDGVDAVLGQDAKPPPQMRLAGRIEPFLALAFLSDGRLLCSASDGRLLLYDGRTFALLAEARLPSPALRLALDEPRGLLHVIVARKPAITVSRLGERRAAAGDLMSFDVGGLLAGTPGDKPLAPLRLRPTTANVVSLVLSRDGKRLWCLREEGRKGEALLLDALSLATTARREFTQGGLLGLCLPPAEDRAYVLGGGRLFDLSADLKEEKGSVAVGGSVQAPAALGGGIVLLTERRLGTQVLAVDVPARRLRARWICRIEGKPTLQRNADGSRAYLATSAVLNGRLWAIGCAGPRPALLAEAKSSPASLLRGAVHVRPDGKVVVLGCGAVLASGT